MINFILDRPNSFTINIKRQILSASHGMGIQSLRGTSDLTSPIFFDSWQLSFGRYNVPKFERPR